MNRRYLIDDVCLWCARLFAGLFTIVVILSCIRAGNALRTSYAIVGHWQPLFTTTLVTQLTLVVLAALLNLSLFLLGSIAARCFLFALGAWFFIGGGPSVINFHGIGWKLSVLAAIFGFASIMWIGIRPNPKRLNSSISR
jgi:hypothetical protein